MKVCGTVQCARIEIVQKHLNVICASAEKAPQQGNFLKSVTEENTRHLNG